MCLMPLIRIVNNAPREGELARKWCEESNKYKGGNEEREILGIRDAHREESVGASKVKSYNYESEIRV